MSKRCPGCTQPEGVKIEITDEYIRDAFTKFINEPIISQNYKKPQKICEYLSITSKKSNETLKTQQKSRIPIFISKTNANKNRKKEIDGLDEGSHRNRGLTFNPATIYNFGEAASGCEYIEDAQDFTKLHNIWLEIKMEKNESFVDNLFPSNDMSIYGKSKIKYANKNNIVLDSYTWLRPGEIVDNPIFVNDYQNTRFLLKEDEVLISCSLLEAIESLTQFKHLFTQVVPEEQDFNTEYAGIFHFRFWQFGRWIDIVIDDKLPTKSGKLVYMQTTTDNSFFCPLLEKAYAKLYGSYEAIAGTSSINAMIDLTGSIGETIRPDNEKVWLSMITDAYQRGSVMKCSIQLPPKNKISLGTYLRLTNLLRDHSYTLTAVKYVELDKKPICLVRLRNPWCTPEWKGDWRDKSPNWEKITGNKQQLLSFTKHNEGEFWISLHEFEKFFNCIEIFNLNIKIIRTTGDISEFNKFMKVNIQEGSWVPGITAGGWISDPSFAINPQYILIVEADKPVKTIKLIISLMQKIKYKMQLIGYAIYKLENLSCLSKPLNSDFFNAHKYQHFCGDTTNRDSVSHMNLTTGAYCIIPMMKAKDTETQFLLRVFSNKPIQLQNYDEDISYQMTMNRPKNIVLEENSEIFDKFDKIAGDAKEMNWLQLKNFLDESSTNNVNKEFSKDLCRSLIGMVDENHTGKVGLLAFKSLWIEIKNWMDIFMAFDKTKSGILGSLDFRLAFDAMGFKLNNRTLINISQRFGSAKKHGIELDEFLMCSLKLKRMIKQFNEKAKSKNDADFTRKEWINYTFNA